MIATLPSLLMSHTFLKKVVSIEMMLVQKVFDLVYYRFLLENCHYWTKIDAFFAFPLLLIDIPLSSLQLYLISIIISHLFTQMSCVVGLLARKRSFNLLDCSQNTKHLLCQAIYRWYWCSDLVWAALIYSWNRYSTHCYLTLKAIILEVHSLVEFYARCKEK